MMERVGEIVRQVSELRRTLKEVKGKYYRLEQENRLLEKRVDISEE